MAARCWRSRTRSPGSSKAVTHYVALRLIERERALAADPAPALAAEESAGQGWRAVRIFLLGLIVGSCAVFAVLWAAASRIAN